MFADAVGGERRRLLLLLLLAAGLTDSATPLGLGSSLLEAISVDVLGEVKGWVRFAGSCMFVKSKAPDGGETLLLGMLLSSPLAGLHLSISSLSGSFSFNSISRPILSLRPSCMLLLWLIVVLWKCWISTHKLSAGPPSAILPRFWRTTHTHTILSADVGANIKSDHLFELCILIKHGQLHLK